ncbi:bestrophin family protein [Leptolyngbya sp. PCC 6406]|uniref:bestrophin family protein n=1 Tax=Leptolyngbya sp. PCC 6406 TaxID=1173264 RepID=UPI0002AD17BA|nr:bestrophin family ion channel [Leptolyngbya sp. PCC 6406]
MLRQFIKTMACRETHHWFLVLFRWQGSVLPAVLPRAFCCALFGALVADFYRRGWAISLPVLGSVVPSIVLGLLLVFRTNTAYERFWEGRKIWGHLINLSRNLARHIWVSVDERVEADRHHKINMLRLLVAFAIALKLHLRSEPPNAELAAMMTPEQFQNLQAMNHPALQVAFWMADYLQDCHTQGRINTYQLAAMMNLINGMVDAIGGCERILKTPIPLAYSVHLKQLLMLYCLALPFQVVDSMHGWTALIVGLISFAVFGIEEIGIEIENPFGHDPNDLPLDLICLTMKRNIEDLISLAPSCSRPQEANFSSAAQRLC